MQLAVAVVASAAAMVQPAIPERVVLLVLVMVAAVVAQVGRRAPQVLWEVVLAGW